MKAFPHVRIASLVVCGLWAGTLAWAGLELSPVSPVLAQEAAPEAAPEADAYNSGEGLMSLPMNAYAVQVATGGFHTCALLTTGFVQCWGYNFYGQLGDGSTTDRLTPVAVSAPLSNVVALAAGDFHTCALTSAGGLWCWGLNGWGQLGDGTATARMVPTPVSGLSAGVVAVDAGNHHTCALTSAGGLWCWGFNGWGQLGDGTTTDRLVPTLVNGLSASVVAGLVLGMSHTCAFTMNNVFCWGSNMEGQLGNGTMDNSWLPTPVHGLTASVVALAAGGGHTCALTAGGGVWCWGNNEMGQLGDTTFTSRLTPTPVTGLTSGTLAVTAGYAHTCAVTAGGAQCWGMNAEGQLGIGDTLSRTAPTAVSGLTSGVASLSAGGAHTCAVLNHGELKCWGRGVYGILGNNMPGTRLTPVTVRFASLHKLLAGSMHTCGFETLDGMVCWGSNAGGQLGDGTLTSRHLPTAISSTMIVNDIVDAQTAGAQHTCLSLSDGSAHCWGDNSYGQLGTGDNNPRLTPAPVVGLADGVSSIHAGAYHTCALLYSNKAQCWGNNSYGQLGNGTTLNSIAPVTVTGLASGVMFLAAGVSHTCAVRTGGTVQCWGSNSTGELGIGNTVNQTMPVTVTGGLSNVTSLKLGWGFSCALTTVGGVFCWGVNDSGQVGTGALTSYYTTPVPVSGLSSGVVGLAVGESHACAVLTGGGMRCWGNNDWGQLGDGTTVSRRAPASVVGLGGNAGEAVAGKRHTCVALTNGAMQCWGANNIGQLGDGTGGPYRITPVSVQAYSGSARMVMAGDLHTCALTPVGGARCWGVNSSGQVGDGTTSLSRTVPVAVSGLVSEVTALAGGEGHTCALTGNGGVRCWGVNTTGQLGDGTTSNRTTPVTVTTLASGAVALGAGAQHTCAVVINGVRCWGWNESGQLGNGATSLSQTTPVTVSGLAGGVTSVAGGYFHTCAVTILGGVRCWGGNSEGQLGDNTTVTKTSSVAVSGLSYGVAAVVAGGLHTCALTIGGGVKCWGNNQFGQLGDGTTTRRLTPVNVSGLTSGVVGLAAGWTHTCAVKADGSLVCWGDNVFGQLGIGSTSQQNSPVNVSGLVRGIVAVTGGNGHTCALTAGGGVRCWGRNVFGQLGDASTTQRLTPAQTFNMRSAAFPWLTSAAQPAFTNPFTVTAILTGAVQIPSGDVQFTDNGLNLDWPMALTLGKAEKAATLPVGLHLLRVTYTGDLFYLPAASAATLQIVWSRLHLPMLMR